MTPLRTVHGWLKRLRTGMEPAARNADAPHWEPLIGEPNWLTLRRFTAQLIAIAADRARREQAASAIRQALCDAPHIEFVDSKPGCRASAFFLSMTIAGDRRDSIVNELHRQGLFLVWAWNAVPRSTGALPARFRLGSRTAFIWPTTSVISRWRNTSLRANVSDWSRAFYARSVMGEEALVRRTHDPALIERILRADSFDAPIPYFPRFLRRAVRELLAPSSDVYFIVAEVDGE